MSDPAIRSATADDTPEILDLIATSYRQRADPGRLAYWQWKHAANPFGISPCLVAESDGRLVGVRTFMRWNWRSGHETVRAVRAVDTATHPEWQGKGIFSRLTKRLVDQIQSDGISFVYNTPNGSSMPGYLKMGWTLVARIPLWVRPLRAGDMAWRTLTGAQPAPPSFGNLAPAPHVLNDKRLSAFLSDVPDSDERYHTLRTPEYLRWRYTAIPGMAYFARFEMTGDAGALIVARGRIRGSLREVTISELLVTPSRRGTDLGRALVAELVNATDADYVAACAAGSTIERRVLARAGFVPVPRLGPHFTARRLNAVGPDPSRWNSWRCSIGDLELF